MSEEFGAKILSEKGTWIFCAAVNSLELTDATDYEHTVNRVTFIDSAKLPHRRKRFGFPKAISSYSHPSLEKLLKSERTLAIVRLQGSGQEARQNLLRLVKDELSVLALSQLGFTRRRRNASPSIGNKKAGLGQYLLLNSSAGSWLTDNHREGKLFHLTLDEDWKRFNKISFYPSLLKILRGEIKVKTHWRKLILRASILAGQSQGSTDIAQAFLWNMIVIESLLAQQSKIGFREQLPANVEAFIGWANEWSSENFQERIQDAYQKRCALVHDAVVDEIGIDDILFTDVIVLNILQNITAHPGLFNSKQAVLDFSNKLQAERVLGLNINSSIGSKIRPKTLSFHNPIYTDEDYKSL